MLDSERKHRESHSPGGAGKETAADEISRLREMMRRLIEAKPFSDDWDFAMDAIGEEVTKHRQ